MVLGLTLAVDVSAQDRAATTKVPFPTDPLASVPKLAPIVAVKTSELADVVERYQSDQGVLSRRYDGVDSPEQRTRMRGFLRRGARACARSTLTS